MNFDVAIVGGDAWRRFAPGMALTVEPGLYLRGAGVPEDPDEVEALVSSGT